jgi:competence protein ComEA
MLKTLLMTLFMVCAWPVWANPAVSKIDLNTATVIDLDGLKGIGPSLSSQILDERSKGGFKNWKDFVSRTPGLGGSKAAKLSAQGLTVQGLALAEDASMAEPPKTPKKNRAKASSAPQ